MNYSAQAVNRAPGQSVTRVNKLHILILIMYGVYLSYPALANGYVPSRDVLIHLLWSSHFSDQLWAGDLYPRWLMGMNGDFGSPTFIFYGPLPYYITALLRPLLGVDPEGWHQLGVSAALAVLLSGIIGYAWLKSLSNETGALIGALLYMSAPYHLACDLYDRFGFAELWAFVWLPLVMLMVHHITSGRRTAVIGLALSYGALTLTHLPTTMIFSWIPLLYAVIIGERKRWVENAGLTLAGMGLGLGMAAIYVIPALLTQHNVSFADMRKGFLFYGYHFLYYGPRFNAELRAMVTEQGRYAALMLGVVMVAWLIGLRSHDQTSKRQSLFWVAVALAAFGTMLPMARPVWDVLPPLQAIQFPWRFNMLLTLAGSAVAALGIHATSARGQGWKMITILAVCAYATTPTWREYLIHQVLARTPGSPSINKMERQFGPFNPDALENILAAKLHRDAQEYRPKWVPYELLSRFHLFVKKDSLSNIPHQVGAWIDRKAQVPGWIELTTGAKTVSWIPVHQFYYPNWTARIAGSSERLRTRPSEVDGRLEIQVPPGAQHVFVSFEPGPEERVGMAISLASLLMLLVLAWLFRERGGINQR